MSRSRSFFSEIQPLTTIGVFLLANTVLFFLARLALLYFLFPEIADKGEIPQALYIGLKFDARMAVFMTLPLAFCLLWPALNGPSPGRSLPAAGLLHGKSSCG